MKVKQAYSRKDKKAAQNKKGGQNDREKDGGHKNSHKEGRTERQPYSKDDRKTAIKKYGKVILT